jgi:transposase-like protein
VAIGIGTNGFRHILGVAEGENGDLEGWRGFPRHLKVWQQVIKGLVIIVAVALDRFGAPSARTA